MQRYFIDLPYTGGSYELAGEVFHHIVRVMRMEPGEKVYLVFPDQTAIIAEITEVKSETVVLTEVAKEEQAKELPVFVTIASGYPKGDKLEWIVQKGTELGAAAFIGFPARASVVKWDAKKLAKTATLGKNRPRSRGTIPTAKDAEYSIVGAVRGVGSGFTGVRPDFSIL